MGLALSIFLAVGIGLITSSIKTSQQDADAKTEYEHQQQVAQRDYNDAKTQLTNSFNTEKQEVNNSVTQAEEDLNADAKNNFDSLFNGMYSQAFEYNENAMSAGQNTGNELSAMAASGARSSSMAQAVDLESSVNSEALQLQQDQTRANNAYQVNSLLNSINSNKASMQNSRRSYEGPSESLESYLNNNPITLGDMISGNVQNKINAYTSTGGTAWQKYNNSLNQLNTQYQNSLDDLDYEYKKYTSTSNSRFFSGWLGATSNNFSFTNSIDTSKINFSNFGNS